MDIEGETIKDSKLREWIESIVIPPAWTDVWISTHKNGHVLATGRDDKGRKQYRYHPDWQKKRNEKKFEHLKEFGQCLPKLREVTDSHLRKKSISRERVLAAIVRLLEATLIRIGNEEYAQKNDSYGLTTLTDDHANVKGGKITFDFVGKSGKEHIVTLNDKRLARIVKYCQDIPGYELFQYYDDDGTHQTIDSSDVNTYLQEITGKDFTAKVFRTWGGSTLAIKYLCENCEHSDTKTASQGCIEHVANALGNTKAVSQNYYVHPIILEAHVNGNLSEIYGKFQLESSQSEYELTPEERTLLHLIAQTK
ncbi:MAG: hypothetical protein RLP44_17845 [Aggregatilineales bacterium]